MSRTPRSPRNPRTWLRPLGVVTALITFVVAAGSAAYAVWSADVTATGSVGVGQLTASASGSLDGVLRNSELTVTQAVTFTNTTVGTSTRPADVSVVFRGNGGFSPLAELGLLTVWPTTNPALCTPGAAVGSGSGQGNWMGGVTMTTSLARGESVTYCARTLGTQGIGSDGGSMWFATRATATMSVGNFSTSVDVTGNLSTSHIYPDVAPPSTWYQIRPVAQNLCLDVTGGQNATVGSALGTWTCHTSIDGALYGNQWFEPQQLQNTAGDFLTWSARLPAGTGLQASGSNVVAQTTNTAVAGQQWSLQRTRTDATPPATYQIVALANGLCVTAPAAAGNVTLATCNGATNQQFTLTGVGATPIPGGVAPLTAVAADNATDDLVDLATAGTEPSVGGGEPQDLLDGPAGTRSDVPAPVVPDPARTERSPDD
ncbi:RICIN domain-containing protein [Cellulomonas hominis]